MNRPIGITLLALLLGWLSIAGFLWAFAVPLEEAFGEYDIVMRVLAFLYGAFALASSVGLFKCKWWARRAAWGWMVCCAATMGAFVAIFPISFFLGGYLGLVAFGVFVALIFYAIDNYVRKHLPVAA